MTSRGLGGIYGLHFHLIHLIWIKRGSEDEDRKTFIVLLGRISERVAIVRRIRACRDPKDDKFLELAVIGDAELIISGDEDLLALHPIYGYFHTFSRRLFT
jgi:putative PIN family toxin of toxin-antitoxin system